MQIYSADIETTGLLEDLLKQEEPKLHNFGFKAQDGTEILFSNNFEDLVIGDKDIRPLSELQAFLNTGPTLIMHNGLCYDGEAMTILGYDMSKVDIIDSLYLAWYIHPERHRYGLAEYGEEFGVPKPKIESWEDQTQEEYNHRVMQDCRIQAKLWQQIWAQLMALYERDVSAVWRVIRYINGKGKQLRNQQRSRWKLDVEGTLALENTLQDEVTSKTVALAEVMPLVPVYKTKKKAAKCFKANGALSSHGVGWMEFCILHSIDFNSDDSFRYVASKKEGNPGSSAQVKDWLFSLGWEPQTFKYEKDAEGNERRIPQINNKDSGTLDKGILDLIPGNPKLDRLKGLGVAKHRFSIAKGWARDQRDGYLVARANGFTNTLRMKHTEIVNVPSSRVPWGKELRSQLVAEEGYVLLGSDLSSLEDKCKHHYQIPFDPEFVKSQSMPGFDPHLEICRIAGMLTAEQVQAHKEKREDHSKIRSKGKTTNYACQYGAGPAAIARAAKISLAEAQILHAAYWELNKSIKMVAESTVLKSMHGVTWQWNPVSKMWYYLKTKKDRFSTLCQGTGAFVFDTWVNHIFEICQERWGREHVMNGQFHDEIIITCKKGTEKIWEKVVLEAIDRTNKTLGMRKDIACEIQFDQNYSGIH